MSHDAQHTNPNESAADFEIRVAGEGGDSSEGYINAAGQFIPGPLDTEPTPDRFAGQSETVILFNGAPVRIQEIGPNDPARQALGPYVGRYLDNGEVVRIPPGSYIGNDKKRYELGGRGITQGGNVSQSDYDAARGSGAGGAGGGGPTRVGVQAPDPYGAALIKFKEYDALIERGEMTADDAKDAWQRDFDEAVTNRDIATNRFQLQSGLQDTATRRGELEFDILRSSLPEGQSLNLGPAGIVPQNLVNVQELLSQGLPPLSELYGNIGNELGPLTGLPGVAPLELPPAPDFVNPLASKIEAGSPGFLV